MIFPIYNDFRSNAAGLPSEEQQQRHAYIVSCQEKRRVETCGSCVVFDYCEVVKAYLRDFGGLPQASGKGG